MSSLPPVKRSVIAALCLSLCIVLPMAFHAVPNAGAVFAPMHVPVLLCGLLCGWPYGLFCGAVGPLLSSVLTGMPPAAILPAMMVECAVYGFLSGLLIGFVRTGRLYTDLIVSLGIAMLAGRIAAGLARAWFFSAGGYSFSVWAAAYFVTGLPGLVLQFLLIPALVTALVRARLIPRRYEHE